MSLSDSLRTLRKVQGDLEIELNSTKIKVEKVYNFLPDRGVQLPSCPAWTNVWSLIAHTRGGFREQTYDIHMQFYTDYANLDYSAEVATLFYEAFVDKIDGNLTLDASCAHHDLQGGNPTLCDLRWGEFMYVGLDLHLITYFKDIFEFRG